MKKWTGGTLILSLALLLALRYALLPFSSSTTATTPAAADADADADGATSAAAPPRRSRRRRPAHLLSSLPGLDDLFPPPNSTVEPQLGHQSKLVWRHMRPLLARSDALPATADGVREGAAAYLELAAALNSQTNPSAESRERSCPFSVTGNSSSLAIPCGLVEDSAITLIGVPVAGNGTTSRFQIELVGSGFGGGGSDAPIVLHFNVTFAGDDPAIAQNSWTEAHGWGEWELCPAHSLASANTTIKVDGLVRCTEQFGESASPENVNGSQSDDVGKSLKRSAHLSVSFPFAEGHPFTATLWAGLEGFHMTVNGRHETSFAYRERLEPWSVSEVRVAGDVDLLSVLANGLPVSEDLDLVGDVELLKAPPVPKRRVLLLVGVFSTGNNFKRRMALRRSWMQYESIRSGDVAVRFLTGLHKNKQVNLELWQEAQIYGDIQLMPFVDYYSLITLKTVAVCILGTRILPAKYIMKTDDDAFVRIDEVVSILKKSDPHGLLYGLISFQSSPHRDEDSKWFISPEEWPSESYPPWAHGPGYIISRDIAKFIVQGHQERTLQLFKLEDVAMGIWIQEYKDSGEEVNYINDDRFHNAGCEPDYILAHYQSPRLLLCLWEKLHREHEPICCE
ncbi:putative beta-1,3-galactosyltransferase 16 [Ananas comosus]|uniref:Putative beta-1,3-galactosyltransferase 16 n=1 Tax=Ananas comosus TaxID=4615 RepID=A0A199UYT3_ANACO|nr:putative beta-1,3-galactosyltransferase 16 [Ananas comosus]